MRLKKDSSEQKLRGAYYTPLQLADAMVELFASQNISTVLEPSCGDGVFLDALQNLNLLNKVDKLTAVEIEPDEAEKVRDRYSEFEQIEVCTEDFFDFYNRVLGKKQYDLILGNPPYIRYQYLKESQREMQSQILTSHGMKANKLINAWVAFIVACVQLLSEKGKIAFVIPAEILQVAYAEDLRLYLANNLAKITLITFEQLVFPDIEQEVVVFIGEKGEEEKGIRIIEMNNLRGFAQLDLSQNGFQKLQHVKEKWTKYFVNAEEMSLIQELRADKRFALSIRSSFRLSSVEAKICNDCTCVRSSLIYLIASITFSVFPRRSTGNGIVFPRYFMDESFSKTLSIGTLLYDANSTVTLLKKAVTIVFIIVLVLPVPGGP